MDNDPDATTSDTVARIRLRGPADIVTAVPHLIGFTPENSVVLVALAGGRVVFAARLDLPGSGQRGQVRRALARALVNPLRAIDADSAVVVMYPPSDWSLEDRRTSRTVEAVVTELERHDVRPLDSLVVADGRWRSLACTDPGCCPVEGTPVESASIDLRAAFALSGRAPLGRRSDVVAKLTPVDDAQRRRCADAVSGLLGTHPEREVTEQREACFSAAVTALSRPCRGRRGAFDATAAAALLVVAAGDIPVRDALLAWCARCEGRDSRAEALEVACDAVRRAPVRLVAPVACLAAALAYLCGDGALAHVALDRADDDAPDYSLSRLLRRSLDAGLPPSEVAAALGRFSPEQLLQMAAA